VGVEIYGLLTRWNPLNVRRPYALPTTARRCSLSAWARRLHAGPLPRERRIRVVGVDGLKIEPLPEAIAGTDMAPPQPVRDWSAIYSRSTSGLSKASVACRVRHHRPVGQELLTLLHLTLAAGPRSACTAASASAARSRWTTRGSTASITWPLPPRRQATIVDMKNNLLAASGRPATSSWGSSSRRLQAQRFANLQVRMPCLVIGGGLTAIDTATEVMAFYRCRSRSCWTATSAVRAVGRGGDPRRVRRRGTGLLDEFVDTARGARRARAAAAAGETPDFVALMKAWAACRSSIAKACSTRRPTAEPRGNHQVARRGHRLCRADEPEEAIRTNSGTSPRCGSASRSTTTAGGARATPPSRCRTVRVRRGGHDANVTTSASIRHVPDGREAALLQTPCRGAVRRRRDHARGGVRGFLHVIQSDAGTSPTMATTTRSTPATS